MNGPAQPPDPEPAVNLVAIVGMSGRFPGARNIRQFWHNLVAGTESITRLTDAELEDSFDDEVRRAPNFVKARPLLDDVELFDAEFFGMYAREAELTDPQHRLFLECAWEALEDAGCDPRRYSGSIGVFAGSSINTYFLQHVCGDRATLEEFTSSYQVGCYPTLLGAGQDFLATRVSYKFDLKGPSVTLQTACSTSLLAVAQACQCLLLYQADMALAGGVSISFPQKRGYLHQEGGMVSADGHCRPFDAQATGTVFGSGAGVVVLKRLEDALADGDHVYAVIRGCGVNNDGANKVGFTAPSIEGQAAAIEMAHANAGVDARSIGYVECHGTGTPLGDPIEIAALTRAFGAGTDANQQCALGSVKSNIGHLDAAAGVVGLIKAALSLQHGLIPASLHFETPNPRIDFASTPFHVNTRLTPWPRGAAPRRAGVSAFGVGGTNVHVVLEEPPAVAAVPAASDSVAPSPTSQLPSQLLIVSARNGPALTTACTQLAAHLREHPADALSDVAFSLQAGRRAFQHRAFVVAQNHADAAAKLTAAAGKDARSTNGTVAFVFPGQGSQYPNMARDLYMGEPEFRRQFDLCAGICNPQLGDDLAALVYPATDSADAAERLMATSIAQPAIFSVEYALAKLWMSWGIQPAAMIGHSVGEFVAAALAGVMSLEDALALVVLRGRLMQGLPGGAMLAVRLSEQELEPLLAPPLAIAAVNGPALTVASGPFDAIQALEQTLQARQIVSRRLHTSHAFHSPMVDPIVEPLRQHAARLQLSAPTLPYVSCVTGNWIRDSEATSPHYWARHAREPVRFASGLSTIAGGDSPPILLEVGAGNTLSTLAFQTLRGRDTGIVTSLQDATRDRADRDCMLEALGRLWTLGVEPDWLALHAPAAHRLSLPTYPFDRRRFWIDAPARQRGRRTPTDVPTSDVPRNDLPWNDNPMNSQQSNSRIVELSAAVAAILEELSGSAPASTTDPVTFLEMGYDSLFLTQVAQKIQAKLKVKITFRQLLGDYSTIASLAAFLAGQLPSGPVTAATAPVFAEAKATSGTEAAVTPAAVASGTATSGLENLFREQLQTMSQLIARQFEMLQGLGMSPAAAAAPTAAVRASSGVTTAALPATVAAPKQDQQPSRFQVYSPKQPSSGGALAIEHQRHIDELAARYSKRTAGSKSFTQQYRRPLADPRAAAGFRNEWKELVYPIVVERAAGSRLWDVDGNEYVDLVNGFGQTAFGHSPDFVVEAVKRQLELGFAIGPQAELAGKVATLFCELTGNERMTFCNTGSEAVMAAMRLARTVTGRDKIVIFNGDYHGQFDEVLVKGVQRPGSAPRSVPVAPGIPASAVHNMVVLEYATPQSLQWVRENAAELAAVIVEPVQSRHPSLQPYEFLREIRSITEQAGAAFVMDEVVTGFRTHPGGIQALAGVRADLATYGKVVGGGLPIGILAGNSRFMDALDGGHWSFGDDSFPEVGVTFFAGTFVRHPLALSAAWAVLNYLKEQGPQLQEALAQRTSRLAADLNRLFAAHGLHAPVESFSSWFYFNVHNEHPLAALLFPHLRLRGVHIQDGFPCFLTTAHSDADIRHVYDAFNDSLVELSAAGILGRPLRAGAAATMGPDAGVDGGVSAGAAGNAVRGLPLTESQTEVWLAAQMGDEASCAFNESVSLTLHGSLDTAALQSALSLLFERHDALRASFTPTGEEMHIAAARPIELPLTDLTNQSDAGKALAAIVAQDARTPFDLIDGPVARVRLLRLAADHHVLIFTAHHIICDGWSINVLVGELADVYRARSCGETPQLPAALLFSTYARDQAQRSPEDDTRTERFWLDQFRELPKPLDLPTDRPRPALKTYSGASRCRRIDAALHQALKKSGAKAGNTLFVTLLGTFQALIGRLSDQSEVVVGVPTAGQSLLEDQILVGHCVNFLPIRARWSDNTTMAQHLRALARQILDVYEHQNYTLGTLVRKLAPAREHNRVPLAEIQFNLERLADRIELPGLTVDVAPNGKAAVNFDLFLNVIESDQGLRLDCDYNTDLFDAQTVDRWLDCYQALLEAVVADSTQPLSRIACLSADERRRVLLDFNQTGNEFPRERCVHQLFEAQAANQPQSIAAQFGAETLTYGALDRRANQLANLLLQRMQTANATDGAERLVGICVERSLDMLVALLATLKAGCAYVPMDPSHPPARLRYILTDSAIAALITDGTTYLETISDSTPTIHLKQDSAALGAAALSAPKIDVGARNLAYVIYTSGSTGEPKGVEITHRAVVNFLNSMAREPGFSRDDVLLAVTTVSFDIAGLELYAPLAVGARVVIADRGELSDGAALLGRLRAVGATVVQATPATWRILLEAGFRPSAGFKMLCGGEALPRELANRLASGEGELWNMYGPTETTIWSSCCRVTFGDLPVTVGRPIANTQFYVLDRNDQPAMTGVPGQLHIGGEGVARGYHQRRQLTAEKFIDSPFGHGKIYRTGDLARWLPDGQLQILGRIDHQVKLRGFRIELGEIEATLLKCTGISAAAVLLREDTPGAPRLVAYYVEATTNTVSLAELQTRLADQLPDYMLPSSWVPLEALPLTPNGKLDRTALPKPSTPDIAQSAFLPPAEGIESSLATILAEVLHLQRVGAQDDLLQLGADSIQLFQITARANRIGIKLTTKQLLTHRTVAALAELAGEDGAGNITPHRETSSLSKFKRNRRSTVTQEQRPPELLIKSES